MKKLIRKTMAVVTATFKGTEGTPCGFCPLHIFAEHEANGEIHYDKATGKAICPRCRILNGSMGSIIKNDKSKRDDQLKEIEVETQRKADADALVIAERTQTATKTKRKRK